MKQLAGWALLVIAATCIIGMVAYAVGPTVALAIIAAALILTAMVVAGISLIEQ